MRALDTRICVPALTSGPEFFSLSILSWSISYCISIKADSVRCGPHGTSQTRRTLSHFECPRHLTESALIEMQYDMDQERIEREKNSGPEVRAGTHILGRPRRGVRFLTSSVQGTHPIRLPKRPKMQSSHSLQGSYATRWNSAMTRLHFGSFW
jgi:hypothetical protein